MDMGLIIGVAGTIATIVFGFLSIDLFKRKKYPGRITYVKLSLIDLLNNVASNFKEIELLHNNQPINKNIIYIKGALLNNGDVDINSKLTEKDITMELPERCKWLDIKPTNLSEGLNVKIHTDGKRKASFEFDLFRKNEFIQFEGIIESESYEISSDEIDSSSQFSHRIENTSKIEKKTLLSEREIKRKKRSAIIFSIGLFAIILTITASLFLNIFGANKETVYFKEVGNNSKYFYAIKLDNNKIIVSPKNGGEKADLTIEEFNLKYQASNDKLNFWQKFKDSYMIITVQLGFILIIVISDLVEINKARKLSSIMKQ